jgi:hypothetical protein
MARRTTSCTLEAKGNEEISVRPIKTEISPRREESHDKGGRERQRRVRLHVERRVKSRSLETLGPGNDEGGRREPKSAQTTVFHSSFAPEAEERYARDRTEKPEVSGRSQVRWVSSR